jgi:hypothetical protein
VIANDYGLGIGCDRPSKKYRSFRNRTSYNTAINQDLKRLKAHDWPGNVRELGVGSGLEVDKLTDSAKVDIFES